jgi:uncharacterized protein (DUF1697 family)
MSSVVFFRAVNVGGHQKFQPSVLAKKLADFGVVNIGAAGTFVVREPVTAAKLRAEIHRQLPFQPELIICPAREVITLARSDPFRKKPAGIDTVSYVTILQKALKNLPALPLEQPSGKKWEVRVFGVSGRFVLSFWQRQQKGILYPNAVVEKQFGVSATTRNWNTIAAIAEALAG